MSINFSCVLKKVAKNGSYEPWGIGNIFTTYLFIQYLMSVKPTTILAIISRFSQNQSNSDYICYFQQSLLRIILIIITVQENIDFNTY